jgi:glycerophosphoryl diester phosphodiesterase
VFIQSFEIGNLKKLSRMTLLPLVQLLDAQGSPADVVASGGTLTYLQMASAAGLRDIAKYADAWARRSTGTSSRAMRRATSTSPARRAS